MRTIRLIVVLIAAALALLVTGCAANPTSATPPTPGVVATAPAAPAVRQLGVPFDPTPGVTVTVAAHPTTVPVGQTGATAPGIRLEVTWANHTDAPLAQVAPIEVAVSDLDGNMAQYVEGHGASEVYPGHTGTLIETLTFTTPYQAGQQVSVKLPLPVPFGQNSNPFINPIMVTGTPS